MDENKLSEAGKAILDASRDSIAVSFGRGIIGAALGGVVGWFAFDWMLSHGYNALAMPGALVGIGFGLLSRRSMFVGGLFCAVHFPFTADGSLSYFLAHLLQLKPFTLLLLGIGTIFSFWFGKGR